MYVCLCHAVTESTVRRLAREGVADLERLGSVTGCGTGCGCCRDYAQELLQIETGASCSGHGGGLTLALAG